MAATPTSMLQLVGYGLQDIERLNIKKGNPDTRYYSFVYKKRTRWASQWRRVDFDNLADFGRRATVTLPILGELITRATLVVELPDIWTPQDAATAAGAVGPHWSWTNGIGHALCSSVEMAISGQVVDRLDSRLCEVIDEQRGPVEHFDSTNILLGRNPTNYSDLAYRGLYPTQTRPQTVEVVYPFWWNRGPGPQALPIQALAKDKVQLTVQFRAVQDCVFTSSFVSEHPGLPGAGPLPTFAGCPFYDENGDIIDGVAMPTTWHFTDAYWIVEYVSLEDREAAAFRNADLQIPIEQHVAVPVFPTEGAPRVRIPIKQSGLIRDMSWVAQRTEAEDYNAYFLFSRELGPALTIPAGQGIWWPDAQLPNWDYGDGFIRPSFSDRRSDPITAATLLYRGRTRFEMEGPSFFRSLLPALNCRRCPLIDRYIYRYDFGFWPTGGLAETLEYHEDEVRGAANWDKLPARDLLLYMNTDGCQQSTWTPDPTQGPQTYDIDNLVVLDSVFSPATQAFQVELYGADGAAKGAYVKGIIPFQDLRRIPGYQQTYARCVPGGSAAIVVQVAGPSYIWIAVAGAAGAGAAGGAAGSAVAIGEQGNSSTRTRTASGVGGGGGGTSVVGVNVVGDVGLPDGIKMPTNNPAFIALLHKTGGSGPGRVAGGDGYYGGGSGSTDGGGGGSYVSDYITAVSTGNKTTEDATSRIILTPVVRQTPTPEKFNIYIWLTTYNLLRISSGRGALMFSA